MLLPGCLGQGNWPWRRLKCFRSRCRGEGAEPWQPRGCSLLSVPSAMGSGAARARSCGGSCSESREAGIWDKTGFVSPAVTSLISSAAGLCSHISVGRHPPGGCSSHPVAFLGWRPKLLCPRWSLAGDMTTPFSCSLWDWVPRGGLPLARAAEEESPARPWGTGRVLQGAGVDGRGERVSQCLSAEGPPPGQARGRPGGVQQWGGDGVGSGSPPGSAQLPASSCPRAIPRSSDAPSWGLVGLRLWGGSEARPVSLVAWEGEESWSPGFGSRLAPAGAGLFSGPCAALPAMGTASAGGTATSLSLGIWPLIRSGRDGCNLAILAQAFLINFSQAARCFWPVHPVARDCLLSAPSRAFGVKKWGELRSTV